MKTHLPYIYRVAYVPKHRKRPVTAYGAETITVEVPEISLSDTELAVSIDYLFRRRNQTIVNPFQYRSWNRDILVPVSSAMSSEFPVEWLPTLTGSRCPNPRSFFTTLYGFSYFEEKVDRLEHHVLGDRKNAADFDDIDKIDGHLVASERDADYATVARIGQDLVSVDGVLWRKTRKVGLQLDVRDHAGTCQVGFHGAPHGYLPGALGDEYDRRRYPCWRKGFDQSQMERLLHHVGDRGVEYGFGELKIVDPEVIVYDGEKDFILRAMDFSVLTLAKTVGDMPCTEAVAWVSARTAVDRVRSEESSDFSDDEIEAFRIIAKNARGADADMVQWAFAACEEYLGDPWGRFGCGKPRNPAASLPQLP